MINGLEALTVLNNIDSYSIIVTDLSGVITYFNKGAEKIFGYTAKEMLGKYPAVLYPDVNMADMSDDLAKIAEGIDYVGVWEGRHKSGSLVVLEIKTTLMNDDQGAPIGFIGFAKDVTVEYRQQEKIKAQTEEKLKMLDNFWREKTLFKSQFVSQMSHEVRTPLNGIMGMMDVMELTSDLDEMQAEQLSSMKKSANILLNNVNNVLDLANLEADKIQLNLKEDDLNKEINKIPEAFKDKLVGHKIDLKVSGDNIPSLICDSGRIKQCLYNLIDNAIKFTNNGSITIEKKILSIEKNKVNLRLGVRDTGVGIPADMIDSITDKFSQLQNSEKGIKSGTNFGTGIGLNLTNLVLRLMNSELKIESKEGKGSFFYFDVIWFKEDRSDSSENQIKHVLSVEDKAINQQVLTMLLKSMKIEVDTAENGQVAVEMVKKKDYDLILMDIQMPIMDGLEATRIIREELKKEIPIVAVTAMTVENAETFLSENKLNGYVPKPVNISKIKDIVNK